MTWFLLGFGAGSIVTVAVMAFLGGGPGTGDTTAGEPVPPGSWNRARDL